MSKKELKIGWSQTEITPSRPLLIEGQMYMRVSQYIHDPITATALALDNEEEKVIFVSLDMTMPPTYAFEGIRKKIEAVGISYEWVTLNVTHTHNSSGFYYDCMRSDNEKVYDPEILPHFDIPGNVLKGEEALDYFTQKVADLIISAWEDRKPGGISMAHEYAAVAFNRRPQFLHEDGSVESIMYGDCSRDDFVGFEGGVDTSVELLYTWDEQQEITGVICNVPCPSQVYELHCFLSADYWGPTRSYIRKKLDKNIYVLSMCGAAGDLSPVDLVWISKTNKKALLDWGGQTKEVFRNFDMTLLCQQIGERISDAVVYGYETAKNYINYFPVFFHKSFSMELPIRQVSEEDYLEAKEEVELIHESFSAEHPMEMEDLVKAFEPQGVVLRYRQQLENPMYKFSCHVLRLGRVAIATNPFELYQEFGQRIKARANAEQVFISQLSNGSGGYLPTRSAVAGGSYSSKPASTTCGPEGGDALVEKTISVINDLWN